MNNIPTGTVAISVNAGSAGTITVNAVKSGYNSGTTSITANAATPTLNVVANPTSVTAGTATSVTFTVTRTDTNAAVSGATVTLTGAV